MPYEFFFSYARADNDSYLRKFFNELSQRVRNLRGLKKDVEVGFFDQNIKLGEEWDPKVAAALNESKVMVCVYSPAYFSSEECGKEWQVFQLRREKYRQEQEAKGVVGATLPPVIKGVVWIAPLPKNLSQRVKDSQYKSGDPDTASNKIGLQPMLQLIGRHRTEYKQFVLDLGAEIVQAADTYTLPDIGPLSTYRKVPSAFASQPPVALEGQDAAVAPAAVAPAAVAPAATAFAPKRVRFVVVAADPKQFGAARSADAYLDDGGGDWRPFWPSDTQSILPFVYNIVSDRELGFVAEDVTFGQDLRRNVEEALEQRKIVIIIVDRWSLHWRPEYQDILRKFDQGNYINCSVIIPQNDDDREAADKADEIEETLRKTFEFRMNHNRDSIFFRYSIGSSQELRDVLREVVVRIKDRMRNELRVPEKRKIETEITFQNISGPNV